MNTLASTDAALDRFAAEVGSTDPIAVQGGGTRWHLGGIPAENARLIEAPTGIVDHQPSEMVVSVRAGTAVADLHDALAAAGQTSALPDRGGTVGGALAVGENRLDRLGRGSVRDAVLQIRYVSAEGETVAAFAVHIDEAEQTFAKSSGDSRAAVSTTAESRPRKPKALRVGKWGRAWGGRTPWTRPRQARSFIFANP